MNTIRWKFRVLLTHHIRARCLYTLSPGFCAAQIYTDDMRQKGSMGAFGLHMYNRGEAHGRSE